MAKDGMANFFLGFGIGIGVGLLFAPKSGEETRDLLLNKADEAKEHLKKQTEGLRESASELVDKGRDAISRQRDTLSDAIQAGKQAYREKIENNGTETPAGL
jgi:gas vesicle protein